MSRSDPAGCAARDADGALPWRAGRSRPRGAAPSAGLSDGVAGDEPARVTAGNGAIIDTSPLAGTALLGAAFALAADAHAWQTDKAGQPYLGHPMRVAARVVAHGEHAVAAALLHDVVEDTGVTFADLRAAGMPDEVCAAVDALTKRSGEAYDDAVRRAAADAVAVHVKAADIADNSDPDRLAQLDQDVRDRLVSKYAAGRRVLDEATGTVL